MLGGAVLNASTFIGGSYLAKYLSGTKTDQERRRHDKALEKYQKDYAKYQENWQKLLDWQEQNRHEDAIASRNFENTDEALKLYNKLHPDENMQINEPVFSEEDEETETNIFGDGVENRGVDDDDEIEMRNLDPYDSSSRRGSEDTTYRSSHSRTYGETSFIEGTDEHTPLITKEEKRDKAWERIRSKFPKVNTTKFTATLDDIGRVFVKLIRSNAKPAPLFNKDGEVNEKLPETIIKALGTPSEDIIRANEEEISRREKMIQELHASRETASRETSENIDANIEEQQNEISRLEAENEHIEEQMSLRDRVKAIFKKYGFTVFAVVSAVGLVIGVIVSNLKKGLTSLGKGVGGALKTIGKKIGEILPGMIGAIASFVFKTAGEAVGFLAKNAWLLILAAVMFMIEKFKGRKAGTKF